jgi:hypothetical protein
MIAGLCELRVASETTAQWNDVAHSLMSLRLGVLPAFLRTAAANHVVDDAAHITGQQPFDGRQNDLPGLVARRDTPQLIAPRSSREQETAARWGFGR